jgi:hypothetical protein
VQQTHLQLTRDVFNDASGFVRGVDVGRDRAARFEPKTVAD